MFRILIARLGEDRGPLKTRHSTASTCRSAQRRFRPFEGAGLAVCLEIGMQCFGLEHAGVVLGIFFQL